MEIKLYDLSREGIKFKRDFNSFKRLNKVFQLRTKKGYIKIDMVCMGNKQYICKRVVEFDKNKAWMSLERLGFCEVK
jgi:hypothetical protein